MADTDDQIRQAMDDALTAGGKEEQYKDMTRKAANFRNMDEGRELYDDLKQRRRDQAASRRASLRTATERATMRSSNR